MTCSVSARWRGSFFVPLVAFLLVLPAAGWPLDLLVPNGGFEQRAADARAPMKWHGQVRGGAGTYGYDTSGLAVEGQACVWLANGDRKDVSSWTSEPLTLQPHRRYRLGLWYRCRGRGKPEVLIAGNDFYLPEAKTWTIWQTDFTPDEKHARTAVTLWLNYRPAQKVFFDAVAVAPVDALPRLQTPAEGQLFWRQDQIAFRYTNLQGAAVILLMRQEKVLRRLQVSGPTRVPARSLSPGAFSASVAPAALADDLRFLTVAPRRGFFVASLDTAPAWQPHATTPPLLHALQPPPDSRCSSSVPIQARCFSWSGKPLATVRVDGGEPVGMTVAPVAPARERQRLLPVARPVSATITYSAPRGAVEYALTAKVSLAPGRHQVEVVATDAAGNTTSRLWTVFADTVPESKVTIGKDLFARFNGRRIFPMGLYCYSHLKHLGEIEAAGFGSILSESRGGRDYLDLLAACGLKVLLQARGAMAGTSSRDELVKSWLTKGPVTFKNHPALLAYWTDEVEGHKYDPAWVQEAQRVLRQLDPHHPLAACLYSVGDFRPYGAEAAVLFPDIYPVPYQPVIAVARRMDAAYASVNWGKPVWLLPQAFDWRVARTGQVPEGEEYRPTGAEMKNMAWLGIVRGARALQWWASDSGKCDIANFPDRFAALCDLTRQIRSIEAVLWSPQIATPLRQSPKTPGLLGRAWRVGPDLWLAVVNPATAPWAGYLNLPPLRAGQRVYRVFEDKQGLVGEQGLADSLAPLAVHIYRFPGAARSS